VEIFDACKTRMIGLLYGEKNYDDMLRRFHLVGPTGTYLTDGGTDGRTHRRTDLLHQYRASVC